MHDTIIMKVIGKDKIAEFLRRNEGAKQGLNNWVQKTEAAKWKNASDIKATLGSVDVVGDYYVFDIVRNRFRLAAIVIIKNDKVIIDRVMTHAQYSRWCRQRRR